MANRRLIPLDDEPEVAALPPASASAAPPPVAAPAGPAPLPGYAGAPSAPNVPFVPAPAPAGGVPAPVTRGTGILSQIDAAGRGIADAATFGTMDEIAAYLGSLTGVGGERGKYDANLATQRGV